MKNLLKDKGIALIEVVIALSVFPAIWLISQSHLLGGIEYALGNILGIIGAIFMWWQFILGIRFISRRISVDYVEILTLHKFLGKYGVLLALIHPFFIAFKYADITLLLPSLPETAFEKSVALGRVAFIALGIVWVTSAIMRSRIRFRPWLYIHYLVYPSMILVFLHAKDIGSFLALFPFLKYYWYFLMGTFGLILLFRLITFLNFGRAKYTLTHKTKKSGGITIYEFAPVQKYVKAKIGQFAYIRPRFFGEAHPFTIMKLGKNGNLIFGIKAVGPFTNYLESLEVGDTVFVDGPFGVFTQEGQDNAPKVIFAGGIGVTPFVSLVTTFGGNKTIMFYANRKLRNALFREQFKKELQDNYIDVVSGERVKGKSIIKGRITKKIIEDNVPDDYFRVASFFLCGPISFMSSIKKDLISLGVSESRIYSEEFSL